MQSPETPHWLPPLLDLSVLSSLFDELHAIFEAEIAKGRLRFRRCPVHYNRQTVDGYPSGFWHLVERENKSVSERQLDLRRAERLSWCAAVIGNCDEPEVVVWDYEEGSGKIRTYLWLRDWDYVVILSRRDQNKVPVYFLLTAFHVSNQHKRDDLNGRYTKRIA